MGTHSLRHRLGAKAAERCVAADEAGASDGASQLIRSVSRTNEQAEPQREWR